MKILSSFTHHCIMLNLYDLTDHWNALITLLFKSLWMVRYFFLMFFKEVSSAHQGCNYLIKNTVKTVILWNIIPMIKSCIFSIITRVFSVTWSFRNHYNMMMCCSRNISYYYLYCGASFFFFFWKSWCIFQDSLKNRKFKSLLYQVKPFKWVMI